MRIIHVVGARPNFMKAAPVIDAIAKRDGLSQILVHTGQHYDANMSQIFFDQLGMPKPDFNLEVGSGSHARQTAEIMIRFEEILLREKPELLLVYGDVNSTIATALVASKLGVRIGHVEAGLRSWDRAMPEEINRVLTDQISDLFFTPSEDGNRNLEREGIAPDRIHMVGNLMIDTVVGLLDKARRPEVPGLAESYVLVTLHRPSNVDDPEMLGRLMAALNRISEQRQVLFPIHPRTRAKLLEAGIDDSGGNLLLTDPMGYLEFLWLQRNAAAVVTDSGGIQEETTYLGIPCLTMRANTERPVTVEIGTNELIGQDTDLLENRLREILKSGLKKGSIPPLWDGKAGERVAGTIEHG